MSNIYAQIINAINLLSCVKISNATAIFYIQTVSKLKKKVSLWPYKINKSLTKIFNKKYKNKSKNPKLSFSQ